MGKKFLRIYIILVGKKFIKNLKLWSIRVLQISLVRHWSDCSTSHIEEEIFHKF